MLKYIKYEIRENRSIYNCDFIKIMINEDLVKWLLVCFGFRLKLMLVLI